MKGTPQRQETKPPLINSSGKNPSRLPAKIADPRLSTSPSQQVIRKPLSSSSSSRQPARPQNIQSRLLVSPANSKGSLSPQKVESAPKPRSRASATLPSRPGGAAKNTPLSESELNEYAGGLLSDDELFILGKDGNFDSDF